MWRLARRWCLRPSISLLVSQRRAFSSGAGGEDIFERYPSIENSTPKRIEALQSKGMALDEWIATEKVHGANFSLYSIAGQSNLQFAKRSGMLPRSEHFFGYHLLIPELTERMGRCRELLAQSLNEQPHVVVVNGELFGGKYDHPQVPTRRTTVLVDGKQRTAGAVQTDAFPQYSPDLHFYAFDMQYKIAPYAPTFTRLTYDAALRIFEQVPGLLYAKPILRGPLYKILAFNVDKFQTTIPAQLGLGNYPLQDNWAEGIVVRHARRGEPLFDKTHSKAETLFKIKSTAFQEISTDPADGPRTDVLQSIRHHAMTSQGVQLPAMESVIGDPHLLQATEHLLRHICHARLTNTLSKLGTEPFESEMTPEILADALLRDALTDFLKEADLETVNAPITMRREMVRYAALYSRKFVIGEWSKILQNVEEKSAAG